MAASLEDLRLNPGSAAAYTNLVSLYPAVNRLDEADGEISAGYRITKLIIRSCMGIALELPSLRTTRPRCSGKSPRRVANLGRTCCSRSLQIPRHFTGASQAARKLSQRAIDSARSNDSKETAAAWQMNVALREAEFKIPSRSRQVIAPALADAPYARCKRSRGFRIFAYRRYRASGEDGTQAG